MVVGATRHTVIVSKKQQPRYELARQVVITFGAGLVGYLPPSPVVMQTGLGEAYDDDATDHGHDDHCAPPTQLLWCRDVSSAAMASNVRFAARSPGLTSWLQNAGRLWHTVAGLAESDPL
jgi:hypothetical protein